MNHLVVNDFSIRKLDKSYIPQMLSLQEEVLITLKNPDILRRNTYETLEVCFSSPSLVLGAFDKNVFAGFGILYIAGEDSENLAYSLDSHEDLGLYGNIKLVIVRKQYRGNGLQKKFVALFEKYAYDIGIKYLLSTVSPNNLYSSRNLEESGYSVVKQLKKYGGKPRLLYYKNIAK